MKNNRLIKSASDNSLKKKEAIKKLLAQGDKRSYNEIAADIELEMWRRNYV